MKYIFRILCIAFTIPYAVIFLLLTFISILITLFIQWPFNFVAYGDIREDKAFAFFILEHGYDPVFYITDKLKTKNWL